jgi:predicted CxxxxCH...CXXCH cytochrome family protein
MPTYSRARSRLSHPLKGGYLTSSRSIRSSFLSTSRCTRVRCHYSAGQSTRHGVQGSPGWVARGNFDAGRGLAAIRYAH